MRDNKKINLIPSEVKEKYITRYMIYTLCGIAACFLFILAIQYARIGITSMQIAKIEDDNARYETEQQNIINLQKEIESYKQFMKEFEGDGYFPFARFMQDLQRYRPTSVNIISVDSPDRLINEGKQEDKKDEKKEEKKQETKDDKNEEQSEESPEKNEVVPEIKYESDLSGKIITIRGYGKSQDDISKFIYDISNLTYISNAEITGIEEHIMPDFQEYNIFEIKVVCN